MTETILPTIQQFRSAFSASTFKNFRFLFLAWLINPKQGWISNCLRAFLYMPGLFPTRNGKPKHFSCFYRFFTEARWDKDEVGRLMATSLQRWLPQTITIIIDDTLCRRTGPMILGAGSHHDPIRTQGGGKKKKFVMSFGLNFVILAIWIPMPFVHSGGMAIPTLFRLYRSQKTCPAEVYRKRSELAAELLTVVRRWWPKRRFEITVDQEYACKTVFRAADEHIVLTGPIRGDAALFPAQRPEHHGGGRKTIWGSRLPSPQGLADDPSVPWQESSVMMYGVELTLLIKSCQVRWKSTGTEQVVTITVTRDPRGIYEDAYFLRTEADAPIQDVLTPVCRRWSLEVAIRDSKQHLHLEQIENGYVHRAKAKQKPGKKISGPQAPMELEPIASKRTVPLFMLAMGFAARWYLEHGDPKQDVRWARFLAPWWRHKTTISFGDMLQAFRRQMEKEHLWKNPFQQGFDETHLEKMPFRWPGQNTIEELMV
jgi:hypothetical protein